MGLRLAALVSQKTIFQLDGGTNSAEGDGSTNDGDNSLSHGAGCEIDSDSSRVVNVGENGKVFDGNRVLLVSRDSTIQQAFDVAAAGDGINLGDGINTVLRLAALGSREISAIGGCSEFSANGSRNVSIADSRRVSADGSRDVSIVDSGRVSVNGSRPVSLNVCDRVSADASEDIDLTSVRDSIVQGADITAVDLIESILQGRGHRIGLLNTNILQAWLLINGRDIEVNDSFNCLNVGDQNIMNGGDGSGCVGSICRNEGKHTWTHGRRAHARVDNHRAHSAGRNEGLGDNQQSFQPEYFKTLNATKVAGHSLVLPPDRTFFVRAEVVAMTTSGLHAGFDVPKFIVGRLAAGPVIILDPAGGPLGAAVPGAGAGRSAGATAGAITAEVDETPAEATIGPDAGTGFAITATTITRNDGGSWLDDELHPEFNEPSSFITIANAEDGANDGVHEVTGVTATVLVLGNSTLTPNTDDNTITFNKVVDSIDALVEGDPGGRTDWFWNWYFSEIKGTA